MDSGAINRKIERDLFGGLNHEVRWDKIGRHQKVEIHSSIKDQDPTIKHSLKDLKQILGYNYEDINRGIDVFGRILRSDGKIVIDPKDSTYKIEIEYDNPNTKVANHITIRKPYQPQDDDHLFSTKIVNN